MIGLMEIGINKFKNEHSSKTRLNSPTESRLFSMPKTHVSKVNKKYLVL